MTAAHATSVKLDCTNWTRTATAKAKTYYTRDPRANMIFLCQKGYPGGGGSQARENHAPRKESFKKFPENA